jgi:hypothetical protein
VKLGKFFYTFATGGTLLAVGFGLVAYCGDGGGQVTYINENGEEQSAPPGTTINNYNYPEGTAPPRDGLSLSAESAAGEYEVRLSLAAEAAKASLNQAITCTAADLLIEAHQESRATGVSVERLLLKKIDLVTRQGADGWKLVERVSFRPEDRQKFLDPVGDLAALTEALSIVQSGGDIPTCEIIPETAFGPQGDLVEAGGSYLRLKRQVPTITPEQPDEVAQEVDIDAGETE